MGAEKENAKKSIEGFIQLARELGGLSKSRDLLTMRVSQLEDALEKNHDDRIKMTKDLKEVRMTLTAVNKAMADQKALDNGN